ncbi:hypothetical protein P8452_28020 [Trifolium repens]|nr:hypothetical protein P8452_28020 [Trifolium repens]
MLLRLKNTHGAFYDDLTRKGDNYPKTGRSDNREIVVVLDALTRRQWVRRRFGQGPQIAYKATSSNYAVL